MTALASEGVAPGVQSVLHGEECFSCSSGSCVGSMRHTHGPEGGFRWNEAGTDLLSPRNLHGEKVISRTEGEIIL